MCYEGVNIDDCTIMEKNYVTFSSGGDNLKLHLDQRKYLFIEMNKKQWFLNIDEPLLLVR